MPLSRLLLPLCGLLLALAVTSATAAAPLYGPGEVSIATKDSPGRMKRDEQMSRCSSMGGSLVPMVTEAVYTLVDNKFDRLSDENCHTFMGGSSMLSSSACTKKVATLDCIWYWDQGRYAGIENAVAFYRGNRGNTTVLPGAGMIGTTVENHWRFLFPTERCPCMLMARYGAALRGRDRSLVWSDSGVNFNYLSIPTTFRVTYVICAIDSVAMAMTTTEPPEEGSSRVNGLQVVGFSVAPAAVAIVLVVLLGLSPL